jgi:hypothetical protein
MSKEPAYKEVCEATAGNSGLQRPDTHPDVLYHCPDHELGESRLRLDAVSGSHV